MQAWNIAGAYETLDSLDSLANFLPLVSAGAG